MPYERCQTLASRHDAQQKERAAGGTGFDDSVRGIIPVRKVIGHPLDGYATAAERGGVAAQGGARAVHVGQLTQQLFQCSRGLATGSPSNVSPVANQYGCRL